MGTQDCMSNYESHNKPLFYDMNSYHGLPTPPSSGNSPGYFTQPSPQYLGENSLSPQSYSSGTVNYSITTNLSCGSPYLTILEQPLDKFRFRYKSEMTGTHGSLNGMSSDRQRKQTFPTVQLCNYNKPAVIRCSIYQKNSYHPDEHKPHAHRLVRKSGKEEIDDPHDIHVSAETNFIAIFQSMGIIHTAKKNIVQELEKKKEILKKESVAHTDGPRELNLREKTEIKLMAELESKSIDLNVVCLRFDAFEVKNNIYEPICDPICSHPINNLKSPLTGELKIVRMDHCTSPAKGGREIFLLVERVTKKNIKVRFFEVDDEDNTIWEDFGRFTDLDVHHQYAIILRTPPYKDPNITTQVKVFMELVRPSDNERSSQKEFSYIPNMPHYKNGSKRPRIEYKSSDYDSSSLESKDLLPATLECNDLLLSHDDKSFSINSECYDMMSDQFIQLFRANYSEYSETFPSVDKDGIADPYKVMVQMETDRVCVPESSFPRSLQPRKLVIRNRTVYPYPCSIEVTPRSIQESERLLLEGVTKDLMSFLKTKPPLSRVKSMVKHHFDTKNKTNALHLATSANHLDAFILFSRLITFFKMYNLINAKSEELETALHIAVCINNLRMVKHLIGQCKAKVDVTDSGLNTPFHLAAEPGVSDLVLEELFSSPTASSVVESCNADGDTAVHIAVKSNNLSALEVLASHNANLNRQHDKNGFTPLRFAIENNSTEVVEYLLKHPNVDPGIKDFADVSATQAVFKTDCNLEIQEKMTQYMKRHNIAFEVAIKKELEEVVEEISIYEDEIKVEPVCYEELYNTLSDFTEECLTEIAEELDFEERWKDLAELLDVSHLVTTGMFDLSKSMTKQIISFAIKNNDVSVKDIRDFLEQLGESRCLSAIEKMVEEKAC